MAGIDVSVSKELLPGLLGSQDGLAKLVETVLNQILEAQVTEALGAGAARALGKACGRPQQSSGAHSIRGWGRRHCWCRRPGTAVFDRPVQALHQRSEQAFVLALMELVVQGVSTRKVSAITEELCGASFSKSTVSSQGVVLDARVKAFNERILAFQLPLPVLEPMPRYSPLACRCRHRPPARRAPRRNLAFPAFSFLRTRRHDSLLAVQSNPQGCQPRSYYGRTPTS